MEKAEAVTSTHAPCVGVTAGCHHCGSPLRLTEPGTHHPARITHLAECTGCGMEHALRVELHALREADRDTYPASAARARARRARAKGEVTA